MESSILQDLPEGKESGIIFVDETSTPKYYLLEVLIVTSIFFVIFYSLRYYFEFVKKDKSYLDKNLSERCEYCILFSASCHHVIIVGMSTYALLNS